MMTRTVARVLYTVSLMSMVLTGIGLLNHAWAQSSLQLYYEENAQVELISEAGTRVLIDVCAPEDLSRPVTEKDILLTTHNHGDHRRLDFIKSFPGKQIDVKTGRIVRDDATFTSIAAAHSDGETFRNEGGSNYIFIVDMAGLRIAHFGDIGQKSLTPQQMKMLGQVDIAIMPLTNMTSGTSARDRRGFDLMEQVDPKIIIPTHLNTARAKIAADKWAGYNYYKKALSIRRDILPKSTIIIFMGNNANLIKLPYYQPE